MNISNVCVFESWSNIETLLRSAQTSLSLKIPLSGCSGRRSASIQKYIHIQSRIDDKQLWILSYVNSFTRNKNTRGVLCLLHYIIRSPVMERFYEGEYHSSRLTRHLSEIWWNCQNSSSIQLTHKIKQVKLHGKRSRSAWNCPPNHMSLISTLTANDIL